METDLPDGSRSRNVLSRSRAIHPQLRRRQTGHRDRHGLVLALPVRAGGWQFPAGDEHDREPDDGHRCPCRRQPRHRRPAAPSRPVTLQIAGGELRSPSVVSPYRIPNVFGATPIRAAVDRLTAAGNPPGPLHHSPAAPLHPVSIHLSSPLHSSPPVTHTARPAHRGLSRQPACVGTSLVSASQAGPTRGRTARPVSDRRSVLCAVRSTHQ